ncbi:protein SHORT ROOT IN SALT MEDIUM 1-like isoform X2 [Coffea arabica]|uniref:Protein SHORT ROOT IN SALT MEDIUM 1-like isoform X2 n=1 Tax=Coffea arabica TaxID=13443 RepID=A0A6P6U5G5_COFAR
MYSSRGNNSYGQQQPQQQQQPYPSQSAYTQNAPKISAKGSLPSLLEGRRGFNSSMADSPKFASGDYVSSSGHAFGHKVDQLYSDRVSDYTPGDRHQYGDRHSIYIGRELPSEPASRYAESVAFVHKHQPEIYERTEQPSMLRQESVLKTQSLTSTSLGGNSRQADFLAARGNTLHRSAEDHYPIQDPIAYGGRMDPDPHSLSMLSGSSYGKNHSSSILGAGPHRNVDDLKFVQGSLDPGYGVSLPPGRDYGTGKRLQGMSIDSDYPNTMLLRGAHPMINDHKDDRVAYQRELERRGKEHHRDYSREREKDREREKEWEQEWQREREQERDRERERERKRERERERDRERERQLFIERREKEREREQHRKHEITVKRERTPARLSKERRGTSLTKDGTPSRQESPRHEALHRRHSPPKEKRRDYVCKVYSSRLVEVERDYLSLAKRYPRLFVSPECSKVVVNWPKVNVKLSLYTPVSFEHDFVEDDAAIECKVLLSGLPTWDLSKSEHRSTVWNSKMILMSGLSQNALEELSSGRSYEDRIPHFCNMLRFAVLRRDNSLMAIGGRWDSTDGGDPSVDDSSLVRTVLRYAKDVAHLDLKNCKSWNRFLEIHYDRVGRDGIFSHKEVTVLYVPDLSECLPSLDAWRDQWLAHKKTFFEREQLQTLRKQKSGENKTGTQGSHSDKVEDVKDAKGQGLPHENKETSLSGEVTYVHNDELHGSNDKGNVAERDCQMTDQNVRNKEGLESVQGGSDLMKGDKQESMQTVDTIVPGKKKIVRKVVKQKVAKKDNLETADKQADLLGGKDSGEKPADPEVPGQQDSSSANVSEIKTFKRKKIIKKVVVGKAAERVDGQLMPEGIQRKSLNELECAEDKASFKPDGGNTMVAQCAGAKTAVKKKIIRRVPKKKASAKDGNNDATDAGTKKGNVKDEKLIQDNNEDQIKEAQTSGINSKQSTDMNIGNYISSTIETEAVNAEKQEKKIEMRADQEDVSESKTEIDKQKIPEGDDHAKAKEREHLKDEKERRGRDEKDDSNKLKKELKEKRSSDEAPRHPGLIIQTKGSKDLKLQSLSLSLDSLLDYNEKATEESTFELSLFAESLYEMLQYEMGSRLLTFLQKLQVRFVIKRNQRKRQREEDCTKKGEEKPTGRRQKRDGTIEDVKFNKTETDEVVSPEGKGSIVNETTTPFVTEDVKKNETNEEEDPEEVEELSDVPQHDLANEKNSQVGKMDVDVKSRKDAVGPKDQKDTANVVAQQTKPDLVQGSEEKIGKTDISNQGRNKVDKELLQAFRFFDRNRVGYIRVEDMRLIIHNLGKFLSHRDVKELVQSALLESNTGRDDRILYDKLVNISDMLNQ